MEFDVGLIMAHVEQVFINLKSSCFELLMVDLSKAGSTVDNWANKYLFYWIGANKGVSQINDGGCNVQWVHASYDIIRAVFQDHKLWLVVAEILVGEIKFGIGHASATFSYEF